MSGAFTSPKISVVIPTWNRAALIERAINSALTQTLAPFEILVCDDGSTDNTFQVVQSLASNDPKIKWVPGEHSGRPAIPRNRGIGEAKGDWIAFLDSDDVWLRDKLRRQFTSLSSQAHLSLASCTNAFRYVDEQELVNLVLPSKIVDQQISLASLLTNNYVITSSVLLHSSILNKTNGFPEDSEFKVGEDYSLWLRVATLTNFTYISTPLTGYTDLPQQSVRQGNRSEALSYLKIVKNYLSWLRKYDARKLPSVIFCIIFLKAKMVFFKVFWSVMGAILSSRNSFKRLALKLFKKNITLKAQLHSGLVAGTPEFGASLNSLAKELPKISILMPVFNGEEYIFSAIHSMLKQTYGNFELIVINDASTDGTIEVINSIEDPRIRILNLEKNSGIVSALNAGLDISRGEFIARMDADDISRPERLAAQVQYLENHTEVGLVGSWIKCFGSSIQPFIHRYPLANDGIECRLLFENPFAHSTVLFRKSVVDAHQLKYEPDYQYVEDWKLWAQMKRYTKFSNLPIPLVEYRIGEKGDKYREFQNSQKAKVISENCFDVNFPYKAIHFDMLNKNRNALMECADYLYELRKANLNSRSFKSSVFDRELSQLWVKSCLSLGKIGIFYSFYYNKKCNLNISGSNIFFDLAWIVKCRFADKIFFKFDNFIRH